MGKCPRHVVGPFLLRIVWWGHKSIHGSYTVSMYPHHIFRAAGAPGKPQELSNYFGLSYIIGSKSFFNPERELLRLET